MFSHRDPTLVTNFVNIETDKSVIAASPGHYIWAQAEGGTMMLKTARNLKTGDLVSHCRIANLIDLLVPCYQHIAKLSSMDCTTPHTPSGSIIVNHVAAATFTDTLPPIPRLHRMATLPAAALYILPASFLERSRHAMISMTCCFENTSTLAVMGYGSQGVQSQVQPSSACDYHHHHIEGSIHIALIYSSA